MIKSLNYPFFQVQFSSSINGEDLKNLRKFYAPILGSDAILLYEYLRDLAIEPQNPTNFNDFHSLTYLINMDIDKLNEARIKLESVSLISTMIDEFNKKTLFIIEKPLDKAGLKKNIFLGNILTNAIGKHNYENLVGKDNNLYLAKLPYYSDVSAKLDDVFINESLISNFHNSHQADSQESTQELMIEMQEKIKFDEYDFINPYEGILTLESRVFYSQITRKVPSLAITELIKEIKSRGLNDSCINLVFYYAFEVNGTINFNYVKKILLDFISKGEFIFENIEKQLDNLIKFKNKTYVSKKDLYKSTYIEHLKKLNHNNS
ncbi:DnaD domain protein [Mycoplasmopsis felifaucium]|uniref:DnaD domain protein n=1 Tax=Mycoplasmopsis felifaucium TaxID=35768 RepID=A0ABZ2RTH8_9BACT